MFSNIQCEVTFAPTRFNVSVDAREKSIEVLALGTSPEYDVEPTGKLKDIIFAQPYIFSAVDTTIITNVFANAFISNVQNVAAKEGLSDNAVDQRSMTGNVRDFIRLRGVAEAFESLLDNSLLSMSTAQLMIAVDGAPTAATESFDGYRIGKEDFIYAVTIIELVVVSIFVVLAIKTRFWKDLPAFDITDFKNVVVAATGADTEILQELEKWRDPGVNPLFDRLFIKREGSTLARQLLTSYALQVDKKYCLNSPVAEGSPLQKGPFCQGSQMCHKRPNSGVAVVEPGALASP